MKKWFSERSPGFWIMAHTFALCNWWAFLAFNSYMATQATFPWPNLIYWACVGASAVQCFLGAHRLRRAVERNNDFAQDIYNKGKQDFAEHLEACEACRSMISLKIAAKRRAPAEHTVN